MYPPGWLQFSPDQNRHTRRTTERVQVVKSHYDLALKDLAVQERRNYVFLGQLVELLIAQFNLWCVSKVEICQFQQATKAKTLGTEWPWRNVDNSRYIQKRWLWVFLSSYRSWKAFLYRSCVSRSTLTHNVYCSVAEWIFYESSLWLRRTCLESWNIHWLVFHFFQGMVSRCFYLYFYGFTYPHTWELFGIKWRSA